MILHGIKSCFESTDRDIIHETLGFYVHGKLGENNKNSTGYILKPDDGMSNLARLQAFQVLSDIFNKWVRCPSDPTNLFLTNQIFGL